MRKLGLLESSNEVSRNGTCTYIQKKFCEDTRYSNGCLYTGPGHFKCLCVPGYKNFWPDNESECVKVPRKGTCTEAQKKFCDSTPDSNGCLYTGRDHFKCLCTPGYKNFWPDYESQCHKLYRNSTPNECTEAQKKFCKWLPHSERCLYAGPGLFNCLCAPGYQNRRAGFNSECNPELAFLQVSSSSNTQMTTKHVAQTSDQTGYNEWLWGLGGFGVAALLLVCFLFVRWLVARGRKHGSRSEREACFKDDAAYKDGDSAIHYRTRGVAV